MCNIQRITRIIFVSALMITTSLEQSRYRSCRNDDDCKEINNTVCSSTTEGKCKCSNGYKIERNRSSYVCLKETKLGDSCETDEVCQVSDGSAICNKFNKCACGTGFYNSSGNCELIVRLGETCLNDANCYYIEAEIDDHLTNVTYGLCENGTCKCQHDHILVKNETLCRPPKKLGEECIFNEECTDTKAECSKTCRCQTGYILSTNKSECLKVAEQLGDECKENTQCSQKLTNSVCNNNSCECKADHLPSKNNLRCLSPRKLGEPCENDIECTLSNTNTKCSEKCECGTDYTESRSGTECLRAANHFGEACTEDGQCSKNLVESVCNKGTCGCLSNFNESSDACIENVEVETRVKKNDNSSATKLTIVFHVLFIILFAKLYA